MTYPLRILRERLRAERAELRAYETHIERAKRRDPKPHTNEACGCMRWRRRIRKHVAELEVAVALLETTQGEGKKS